MRQKVLCERSRRAPTILRLRRKVRAPKDYQPITVLLFC